MRTLTSNQYYGGLNRRFEKRAKLLKSLGYKYVVHPELKIALFIKHHQFVHRQKVIPAGSVMHASNRAFIDDIAANR